MCDLQLWEVRGGNRLSAAALLRPVGEFSFIRPFILKCSHLSGSSKYANPNLHGGLGSLTACLWCVLQVERVFLSLEQCSEEEKVQKLLQLKLRYFTPREVANLMGFPPTFCKQEEAGGLLSLCVHI